MCDIRRKPTEDILHTISNLALMFVSRSNDTEASLTCLLSGWSINLLQLWFELSCSASRADEANTKVFLIIDTLEVLTKFFVIKRADKQSFTTKLTATLLTYLPGESFLDANN